MNSLYQIYRWTMFLLPCWSCTCPLPKLSATCTCWEILFLEITSPPLWAFLCMQGRDRLQCSHSHHVAAADSVICIKKEKRNLFFILLSFTHSQPCVPSRHKQVAPDTTLQIYVSNGLSLSRTYLKCHRKEGISFWAAAKWVHLTDTFFFPL